jgi:hypothetical protein
MDAKLLTESGWKAIVQKFKIKDNGLQKALVTYELFADDAPDGRLKALANVTQLAASLKKVKEVAAVPAAAKYLADMLTAADAEQRELAKLKALAEKTAATVKKNEDDAKKKGADEDENEKEEEEEEGDYAKRLLAAFQKLKGAKDLSYEFIVCDAKPHCGLMIARKITPKHKEELTKLTGSKRFLHTGTCTMVNGKFSFNTGQPVTGLAKKLQDSIKNFTGKKLPILVGTESAEGDEEQSSGGQASAGTSPKPPQPVAPPKLGQATLEKAPDVWHSTRGILDTNIKELKQAIRNEYAGESPGLIAGIEETVSKLDVILDKLDQRLADSLAKAHAAKDPAARQAELKNSKAILFDYINYVKSEPLIAHIDSNPLGIQTNLKQVLADSLKHMAQAIA